MDGSTGAAADWLNKRIVDLQTAGHTPTSATAPQARIEAFQRSQGVDAVGIAGPITFMQANLASGVDEPRLLAPPP